ncbi:unnamed protein product [Closterium sp. Naga37s-1]|nr:unnamed protein product [Closterium sp. Naga37s-1]
MVLLAMLPKRWGGEVGVYGAARNVAKEGPATVTAARVTAAPRPPMQRSQILVVTHKSLLRALPFTALGMGPDKRAGGECVEFEVPPVSLPDPNRPLPCSHSPPFLFLPTLSLPEPFLALIPLHFFSSLLFPCQTPSLLSFPSISFPPSSFPARPLPCSHSPPFLFLPPLSLPDPFLALIPLHFFSSPLFPCQTPSLLSFPSISFPPSSFPARPLPCSHSPPFLFLPPLSLPDPFLALIPLHFNPFLCPAGSVPSFPYLTVSIPPLSFTPPSFPS